MNLTGRWKGKYTFGNGYPRNFIGKSEPVEFYIRDIDGNISGFCYDNIVKAKEGNESTIEGSFKDNFISFVKYYKYHLVIDELEDLVFDPTYKSEGVHYVGHIQKRLFSRKLYFVGEWQIASEYSDQQGTGTYSVEGTWSMVKIKD